MLFGAALLCGSGLANAGALTIGTATGAAGTTVGPVAISFAGEGSTVGFQNDITFNQTLLGVPVLSAQNGATCTNPIVGTIRVIKVDLSLTPLPAAATNYCNASFPVPGATPNASYALTPSNFATAPNGCTDSGGGSVACTGTAGSVVVGGGGNVAPTAAVAATTLTGGTGSVTPTITTPAQGTGSTVFACTIPATAPSNFAITSNASQTITSSTLPIGLSCVPQVAATTATLTCTQTATPGPNPANATATITCPAAVVGNTPPTIGYNPAAGATINVASAANTVIQVDCNGSFPDGDSCNGAGSGLAATSRLESLSAVYAGPPFSPTPTMVCAFVNEAGTVLGGSTLDFVALGADAGDIRCTCPIALVPEPFTVTVNERIPASSGAPTAVRTFNIVCGSGACPVLTATPSSGTISFVNGGGNGLVTTYTVTGLVAPATQAINCVTSAVTAGSTFTITTVPNPLVLTSTTTTGTVSASCTNTNLTDATATLTCTPAASAPGCTPAANVYTLSCPGGVAPPQVEIVPVPALGEQGRILLAALMLLLGLAVVGFRVRN
jgi:hypothetical protein